MTLEQSSKDRILGYLSVEEKIEENYNQTTDFPIYESFTKTTTGGKEYEEWRTATENFLSYAEYAVTLPPIKMKRNDTLSFVDIEEGDRLVFQAKYNGILQRTIFDTGIGPYCVLSRKLADGMGVRYDSIDENKVTINEDLISVRSIIDSIEVGNITFLQYSSLHLLGHRECSVCIRFIN